MRRTLALSLAVCLIALAALGLLRALQPAPTTPDTALDAIAATLRCPTCQGLSVADSPSKVAASMRDIIAEQLAAGRSPDEIRAYFVARYGDWVLLSPRSAGFGWLVWLLPVAGLAAGLAIVVARTRRPGTAAPTHEDLATASAAQESWRQGRLALPQTPVGERLESAFQLLASIRQDQATHLSGHDAYDAGLRSVAAALAAQHREAAAVGSAHQRSDPARTDSGALDRQPASRRWAWIGGTATFALVLTAVLVANAAPRGAGELITGEIPDRGATDQGDDATDATDALRAAVDQDPEDTQARLRLAARLLQQPGGLDEAREHAEAATQRDAGQPDALLLLGLAQLGQGDSAAPATLERYLAVAPSGHPGVELARSLLEQQP